VRERPILFSAPMVRALLDGTKTQTRRLVKPQPFEWQPNAWSWPGQFTVEPPHTWRVAWRGRESEYMHRYCPYGQPGDQLWVRETFALEWPDVDRPDDEEEFRRWVKPHYAATDPKPDLVNSVTERPLGWRPSIFMPRWASRIQLEATGVRVERLQDISEDDARAEGVEAHDDDGVTYYGPLNHGHASARVAFSVLWDSLNAERGPWASNPWVWCISFKRVKP
jgi:hypothetical protein